MCVTRHCKHLKLCRSLERDFFVKYM